ncbi:MAG: hypothetical protein AB7G34_00225 [Hyphomicrobiales bacterium]
MTRAALSVYMYALYQITGVCLPLLVIPDIALGMFGVDSGDGVWIRFVGLLAGIIGAFYVGAVLTRFRPMLAWSVPARYVTSAFMAGIVAAGMAAPGLLFLAAFDALCGSITWVAIRADQEAGLG